MNEPEAARATAQPIGAILGKRRKQLKLSLANVELATKIRGKYLTWIEASDFASLPNDIYTRGFISKYADYLGLDVEVVLAQYNLERGAAPRTTVAAPRPVKGRRVIATPRLIIAGAFTIILGLTVAYLGWQFSALAAPPRLVLGSPPDNTVIEGGTITIAGQAAMGSDVFVNDTPILTDAHGGFSDKLALQDGLNQIKVTAKNKLGKSTVLTRNILAHLPQTATGPLVPAAVFDGVAVGVKVKDAAITLHAQLDNGEVQVITMLPGTSRSFQATAKLKITTNNSAATSLVITNAVVAAKDLGAVGKGGDVQLEFTKDTNFP
jgi:hypothetical protein